MGERGSESVPRHSVMNTKYTRYDTITSPCSSNMAAVVCMAQSLVEG